MKVKLLKKIRKRYTIIRIDELASNAGELYVYRSQQFGLPFFVLSDDEDYFGFYATYAEARESLCKWIIQDYTEKFRHKNGKETKVWYPKPKVKKRKSILF